MNNTKTLFRRCFPLVLVLVLGLLTSCGEHTNVAELPPVPEIDTSRYLPVIKEQFATAITQVEKFPGKAATNGQLGRLLYVYEQYESAAVLFDRAGALKPKEFEWPYLSGRAKAELGQTESAEASLRRALELRSDYGPINIQLAELFLKASRDDEARSAVERVLATEPERPEAHFILAKLANRSGQFEEALKHLQRVEELSGQFAALHYQYAQLYRALGDDKQADAYLARYEQYRETTAHVVDPVLSRVLDLSMSIDALVERAKRRVTQGDNRTALALLEQAVQNDPESLAAHVTLVGIYASNGRFKEADQHIASASAIDPNHPKLHYAIGVARLLEQRRTEATRAFERSLLIDSRNPDAHVQLGVLLEQQKQPAAAMKKYQRALSQTPNHRIAHWRIGQLLLAQNNATDALAHLQKIRDLVDPAAPEILLDLAKAYADNNRYQEAVVAVEESLNLAVRFNNPDTASLARGRLKHYKEELSGSNSP
ncbi:MAG: tetratricopeptide repeat protein [Gammaproteobacteria bacterium]